MFNYLRILQKKLYIAPIPYLPYTEDTVTYPIYNDKYLFYWFNCYKPDKNYCYF